MRSPGRNPKFSPASTAGLQRMILSTSFFSNEDKAKAIDKKVFPVPAGPIPNTISLHRKKQSNTLYTINALNEVIRELNGGVLDKRFPIPWDDYYNSLLLTNENGLNKIPTKIHSIVDTKNYKDYNRFTVIGRK